MMHIVRTRPCRISIDVAAYDPSLTIVKAEMRVGIQYIFMLQCY